MRIGILTAGGDCPGINATIRSVALAAINHHQMEVIGIHGGFRGLLDGSYEEITRADANASMLTSGGTFLGTSREKPYKVAEGEPDKPSILRNNFHALGLDALVCIGGGGTMKTVSKMVADGLPVVAIPKTIDNDVWGTDYSFGFDSAVGIVADAIDRLHSTAGSHERVMVVEAMGHRTGWLSLFGGMAGGADAILIPELGYSLDTVCSHLRRRQSEGARSSIVVVAEGILIDGKTKRRPASHIAEAIEQMTGIETRETVLGYIQRGGTPSAFDRNLATMMGLHAVRLVAEGRFGHMVSLQGGKMGSIPIAAVAGRLYTVPTDHRLVIGAQQMGVCMG